LPFSEARKLIEVTAKSSLSRIAEFKPVQVAKPIAMDVSFPKKEQTDLCETIPRAKRNGEKTISYIAEDWDEAYDFVRTTIRLAGQYAIEALEEKLSKLEGFDKAVQEWEKDLISEWLS
jgi:D-aminopeptidase